MKKLPIMLAAGLTIAGVAAIAAPHMDHGGKGDADGNGVVSKAEALAMADAHFAKLDGNGDGKLDAIDHQVMQKKHFDAMDADKNGSISEAEFAAVHAGHKAKHEERRRNGGSKHHGRGGIGGPMMAMLRKADTNGDKAITSDEVRASVEAHFVKADVNKDGSLSAAERWAAHKTMREEMRKDSTDAG